MRVEAQNVRPGDRVRGIGLTVAFSEPESDWTTRLEGTVSTRSSAAAGYDGSEFHTTSVTVILPNEHLVNVTRTNANFRADRLATVGEVMVGARLAELSHKQVIERLYEVATAPRGAAVTYGAVHTIARAMIEDPTFNDVDVLQRLDEAVLSHLAEVESAEG